MTSARPPLARTPATKRATVAAWVASASYDALRLQPYPKGRRSRPLSTTTQARNTSAIIAACSAWVSGIRAGLPRSGDRFFSSESTLALPGFRASFVLRDHGHIKSQFRGDTGSLLAAASNRGEGRVRKRNGAATST